ncbi:MAG: hypothetical protein R2726_06900 [Acidimicrobiales bacterium]
MTVLSPPRVEGRIRLADGRRIGFAEYGPAHGRPVLWMHGTPGARRQIPPEARTVARERDVRIVALERPGIGGSTPHAYGSILDWADDVAACTTELGIDEFGVVGLSGGGPYALACAFRLADRTVAGAVIGGVAPTVGDDAPGGSGVVPLVARISPLIGALHRPLSVGMWGAVRALRPVASQVLDLYARFTPPGDQEVFADPEMRAMFIDDIFGASRRQLAAPLFDVSLFARDWGFSLRDVKVPVHFWHGAADNIVPVAHGEHVAGLVPGATVEVRPSGGHLANLALASEVLDWILAHWPDDEGPGLESPGHDGPDDADPGLERPGHEGPRHEGADTAR